MEEAEQILDSNFYLCNEKGTMWMCAVTPIGMLFCWFNEVDWIEWLESQLDKCHKATIPNSIVKAFSNEEIL